MESDEHFRKLKWAYTLLVKGEQAAAGVHGDEEEGLKGHDWEDHDFRWSVCPIPPTHSPNCSVCVHRVCEEVNRGICVVRAPYVPPSSTTTHLAGGMPGCWGWGPPYTPDTLDTPRFVVGFRRGLRSTDEILLSKGRERPKPQQ